MKKFDALLARIEEIRNEPLSPVADSELRKALRHSSGYIVGKAAAVAAHRRSTDMLPDLLAAFNRLMENPVKTDPQCWGKNSIVTALGELGHDDPEVYLRGLRHVQREPVWGGTEDTAGTLRGRCGLALAACASLSDTDAIRHLLKLLIDPEKGVRIAGVQAIARISRAESALLLRLKALAGDSEPEVTGTSLTGVLSIEGTGGLDLAADLLHSEDADVASEAALALGLSRLPEAIPLILTRYATVRDDSLASVLLTALAVSHDADALAALFKVVEEEGHKRAQAALKAVRSAGSLSDEVRQHLIAAAERNEDPRVGTIAAAELNG